MARYICTQTSLDERDAILGWYALDEPKSGEAPNLEAFHTIVNTVQDEQTNHCQDWPFYPDSQVNKLSGTAGYWDGKDNSGQTVDDGLYYAYMYADGTWVDTKAILKE